jgi:hypothetical protein
MSVYIAVELRRQIRTIFADRCAYCRTLETLTVTTFEIEHIITSFRWRRNGIHQPLFGLSNV